MGTSALIQLATALLPLIQTEVPKFIVWVESLVSAAKQAGEWSPEQDAAFKAAMFAKTNDPAYQPDKP